MNVNGGDDTLSGSKGGQTSHFDYAYESPERDPNSISREMANRLFGLFDSQADRIAHLIYRCATNRIGWRCGHTICPRCAVHAAKRRKEKLKALLRKVPRNVRLAMVTVGVSSPNIEEGRALLVAAFGAFRRQKEWKLVVGWGMGQIEVLPSLNGSFNVHAHVLVSVLPLAKPNKRALSRLWRRQISPLPGTLDWKPLDPKFERGKSPYSAAAYYVTKKARSAWLRAASEDDLRAIVRDVPGKRFAINFGFPRITAKNSETVKS